MPLSRQAIEELKVIHKKNFGEDLTDAEAVAMGNRIMRLFAVLLRVPTASARGSNPVALDRTPKGPLP